MDSTSRRAVIAALAGAPFLAGTMALAISTEADAATPGEPTPEGMAIFDDAFAEGQKDMLAAMAMAWIDRWQALGGHFGLTYNADRTEHRATRGIPMSYTWTPPSFAEAKAHSPTLRPHEWIAEREDFNGAHKMLESFLTLIPSLEGAVFDQARPLIEAGRAKRDAAIAESLATQEG